LFVEAQIASLVLGVVAILLKKKNLEPLPLWREAANKWIGRVMAAATIFYLIAFALIGQH
jgi:hypothetical protein